MRDDEPFLTSDTRRAFLAHAAAWAVWGVSAGRAEAKPGKNAFEVVRLRSPGLPAAQASAVDVFQSELKIRTSISVKTTSMAMAPNDPRLGTRPFAILRGTGDFSWSPSERRYLKRWLELGGFLFVDNAGKTASSKAFDKAVRRELKALFPTRRPERVSPEHVIFRSFYRLDYPAGRVIRAPHVEGITLGRRFAVIFNQNDLFGAFAKDASGRYLATPVPGGASQREMAFRFAVNLVMYALCLHYKDDQVHLDYLLHRRKWKVKPPR